MTIGIHDRQVLHKLNTLPQSINLKVLQITPHRCNQIKNQKDLFSGFFVSFKMNPNSWCLTFPVYCLKFYRQNTCTNCHVDFMWRAGPQNPNLDLRSKDLDKNELAHQASSWQNLLAWMDFQLALGNRATINVAPCQVTGSSLEPHNAHSQLELDKVTVGCPLWGCDRVRKQWSFRPHP